MEFWKTLALPTQPVKMKGEVALLVNNALQYSEEETLAVDELPSALG